MDESTIVVWNVFSCVVENYTVRVLQHKWAMNLNLEVMSSECICLFIFPDASTLLEPLAYRYDCQTAISRDIFFKYLGGDTWSASRFSFSLKRCFWPCAQTGSSLTAIPQHVGTCDSTLKKYNTDQQFFPYLSINRIWIMFI